VLDAKRVLVNGINAIPGLRALENDLMPLAFGGTDVDLTLVKGEMSKLGWVLLGAADPPLINLPIDAAITNRIIETFLEDLRQVATRIRTGALLERVQQPHPSRRIVRRVPSHYD
jgi:hypothetical protein